MSASSPVAAYAALATTSLLWAGNTVAGRALAGDIPPAAFAFWRWLLVVAVLAPFVAPELARKWPSVRRNWRLLALLGLMSTALYHALVFWALHYTTAINAQILNSTVPVLVMLVAWIGLGTRPAGREWLGFALSAAGVLAIVTHGDWRRLATLELNTGDLMMLGIMLVWAVYTVTLSRHPPGLSGLGYVCVTGAFGLAGLAPFFAWELATGRGAFEVNAATLGGILYTALFASIAATVGFAYGLRRIGPTLTALFTHLVPVFGALLSVLLLGERLGLHHLAGFALILGGIAVANGLARVLGRPRAPG
jgi:drug/metabolite transporter (DMT)-like permease